MSRGIGPVLLTHFTPDETTAISDDTVGADKAPDQRDRHSGVLVAPAPTGKVARHRAGRGRRALVLTKSPTASTADAEPGDTSELPRQLVGGWRRSPRLLLVIALAGGAVVLAGFGLGMANATRELPGTAIAAPGSATDGMQPGTLPAAALAGAPTTTTAPPPPPPTTPARSAPTHHATSTHAIAPAPPPSAQNPPPSNAAPALPVPGQPCGTPGQFSIDSQYQPVECVPNPATGSTTWKVF
jgi:hypothetical protein